MFKVNLARKPFWNVKVFILLMIALAILTVSLTIYNVRNLYNLILGTEETKASISQLESSIAKLEQEKRDLERKISLVDTRKLRQEVDILNNIIVFKTIRWSFLFDHLEEVLPHRVRITSLTPAVQDDGSIVINIQCLTEEHDGMLSLIDAFHRSPVFKNPSPASLRTQETGVPEGRQFGLRVFYVPEAL